MCTVTYIPTGTNEFIFTSNRDESPKRSAVEMVKENKFNKTLLYPRDAKAKGTWIAISNTNQLVCILNGAFQKHHHLPPYRMSRGIMTLDFFSYKNATDFADNFDFKGIEPFTLVIFDDGQLFELRWDESQVYLKELDPSKQHLWASCTLYSEEWQVKRKNWLADWNKKYHNIDQNAILDFHKNAGEGNIGYDIVMNRDNVVRTTSITSIVHKKSQMHLRFEDILGGEVKQGDLLRFQNKPKWNTF